MAEVTNDNFLFAEVWPLLKWAQFFGTFPFSKERNVSGVYLTPWTKCHMIGLFGAQWSFFLMSIFGLFAYAYLKNPISLEALMQSTSITALVLFMLQLLCVMAYSIFFSIFVFKSKVLCTDIEPRFKEITNDGDFMKRRNNGSLIRIIILVFFAECQFLAFGYTFLSKLGLKLNFSDPVTLALFVCFLFVGLGFTGSFFICVFGTYFQLCSRVTQLINAFQERMDVQAGPVLIKQIMILMKIIDSISNTFSQPFMISMTSNLMTLITAAYMLIEQALDHDNIILGNLISDAMVALASVIMLTFINLPSETIKMQLKGFKWNIANMEASDRIETEFDGHFHTEAHARSVLVAKIEDFDGFNAGGFATLGKPLLSSILANFLTYLIIFVQFNLSERSFTGGGGAER